jgi:uncharacterized protein
MHIVFRRAGVVGTASATALVLLAAPALAHVTVQGPGATQGGYSKLTFRVPTEKDIPTTQLQIVFPPEAPIANVSVKPHPGWTYTETTDKPSTPLSSDDGPVDKVVTSITWTATNGGIRPGEFDEFDVSAGPLPKVDTMTFKAIQTYADGSVVRWIETAPAGAAEPEHPAPVLKLAAAGSGQPSASGAGTGQSGTLPATAAGSSSTGATPALAVAALAVGVVALLLSGVALLRRARLRTA